MFTKSFLILALSLTALSLPSPNEDLQERGSFGWLASFPSDDGSCENKNIQGARPKWAYACVDFNATTNRIGGSWGHGDFTASGITAYDDTDCQGNILYEVKQKAGDAGFCQPLDDSAHWKEWRSALKWAM